MNLMSLEFQKARAMHPTDSDPSHGSLALEAAVARIRAYLAQPAQRVWRQAAWRAFEGSRPGLPADDGFFELWATVDYAPDGAPRLVDTLLNQMTEVRPAEVRALCALRDNPPRLLVAEAAGDPHGRAFVDALTGVRWASPLVRAVPLGAMVLVRPLWCPRRAPWVGPAVVFSPSAPAAALRARLKRGYQRTRRRGYVQTVDQYYRSVAPALYRAHQTAYARRLLPGEVASAA
jgi:hypothetical protein